MSNPITVNLKLLFAAICYRWRYIVVPIVVVPAALLVFESRLPKKYKATAQVLVQESISVTPFLEDMQVPWTVRERLPIIQAILRSRVTLERVLQHLGDVGKNTAPQDLDDRIADIRNRITVYGSGGGIVDIQLVDNTPERVYKGLTLLVEILIDAMLRPQKQSLEEASRFLKKQLDEVRVSLKDLENKIQTFKQEHVDELPEVFRPMLEAYMNTQGQLLTAQTELRAARMRKRGLEQRLRVYNPIARELEASLVEAKTKLGELSARFKANHPEIIALKAHIEQLKAERKAANLKEGKLNLDSIESAAKLSTGMSSKGKGAAVENKTSDIVTSDLLEYKALDNEIASLEGQVSSLKSHGTKALDSVKSFAKTERTLASLMRDYDVKQQAYTTLLKKYEEARVTKALSMSDEDKQVVLIESPRMPNSPIGLTLQLLIMAGVALGVLLGISVIIMLEFFSGVVRTKSELETLTGLKVVGTLPRLYDFD